MPITQERFMSVVIGAKHIIKLHRDIRDIVRDAATVDIVDAHSVLAHTTDEHAKAIIIQLVNRLTNIREIFFQASSEDIEELSATVIAEELHFRKAAKKNLKARYLQEVARRERGIAPRAPEVYPPIPMVVRRSIELSPPVRDFENTPEYKRFEAQMTEKYARDAQAQTAPTAPPTNLAELRTLEQSETLEQTIERERAENLRIFGASALGLDAAAEAERAAQLRMRTTSYDPDVLRTSAPTASELVQPPTSPDEPVI